MRLFPNREFLTTKEDTRIAAYAGALILVTAFVIIMAAVMLVVRSSDADRINFNQMCLDSGGVAGYNLEEHLVCTVDGRVIQTYQED